MKRTFALVYNIPSTFPCKILSKIHHNKLIHHNERTTISLPLPSNLPEAEKNNILNEGEQNLSTVKQYIDNSLDSRKHNILNPLLKGKFEELSALKIFLLN